MAILCPHISSKADKECSLGEWKFNYFESVHEVKDIWDACCPTDEYWQSAYHCAIESAMPKGLKPYYCLVLRNDLLVGIIYMQHKKINLAESIKLDDEKFSTKWIKKILLTNLNMDTLIVGNLLLTGKYGFHFTEEVGLIDQYDIVLKGIENFCDYIKSKGTSIGPILMKDFFEDQVYPIEVLGRFTKFEVQPNMIMPLRENWKTMSDYEIAMKAKSRTRYHRARNKFHEIKSALMTEEDLRKYQSEMLRLYLNITENVSFNLFYLNESYFLELKRKLGDKFVVQAYFDGDKMVGFFTMLSNHDHLDAHFLGYDPECNKNYQLYLNMLFDMVEYGISTGLAKILMSRTALEIKSSVGAKPHTMYCYLMHRSLFYNRWVSSVVNYLYREVKWEERNPFKE